MPTNTNSPRQGTVEPVAGTPPGVDGSADGLFERALAALEAAGVGFVVVDEPPHLRPAA